MKKFFAVIFFAIICLGANADSYLHILPTEIAPGSTSDDEMCFSVEMVNDETFVGLSFDMYLPKGVYLDEDMGIELSASRFPYTGKKNKIWDHTVGISWHEEDGGFYRITILDYTDNSPIKLNEGPLFDFYYLSDDDMPTGILPVRITNVLLGYANATGVKPSDNISFFYTPDVDFPALTSLDLTTVEGVTTNDVATEARELMTNPNSLLYLNEGSDAEGLENVVVGETCENLVLTDGHDFNAPKAFSAASASYSREIANDGWYSLCLPFAANTPADVTIERFASLDAAAKTVNFDSGAIEADKPCIFNAKAGTVEFTANNAAVAATPERLADDCFIGTYRKMEEGTITGCYALFADGSGFGIATDKAYVTPFRGILDAVSSAQFVKAIHDGGTTSIKFADDIHAADGYVYNLNGQRMIASPQRGIYIINNKKFVK